MNYSKSKTDYTTVLKWILCTSNQTEAAGSLVGASGWLHNNRKCWVMGPPQGRTWTPWQAALGSFLALPVHANLLTHLQLTFSLSLPICALISHPLIQLVIFLIRARAWAFWLQLLGCCQRSRCFYWHLRISTCWLGVSQGRTKC